MLEVSPISSQVGMQPSTPLVDCLVDDVQLHTGPCSISSHGAASRQQRRYVEYQCAIFIAPRLGKTL